MVAVLRKDIRRFYDDKVYHAKGLDVPAKVDANSRSEKKAMHGT